MLGARNHRAKEIHSQYYTPTDECLKLLDLVNKVWGPFEYGTRILEPSVGCGNLVSTSKEYYPDLSWVTNDFFPEGSNFTPDFTEDFLYLRPERIGPVDLVITNPPFSGKVDYNGYKMDMAVAFIRHSFLFSDQVAMILPSTFLRPLAQSMLPDGVEITAWTEPSIVRYHTGGSGSGEEKSVRTSFILFENTGRVSFKLLTDEVEGFRFAKDYIEATHAICLWGNAGECRQTEGTNPWTLETPIVISDPDVEEFLTGGGLVLSIRSYSSMRRNALKEAEVTHYLNLRFNS